MESCILFRQFPQQLVTAVKFLVAIGVLIQFKNSTGKETQKGIFFPVLFISRRRFIHRLGFLYLHTAPDQGVIYTNFNLLSVRTDINMVLLFADGIKGRCGNFRNDPVPVRDFLKGKAAVLTGSYRKQCLFLCKCFGIRRKQTDQGSGQLHRIAAVR